MLPLPDGPSPSSHEPKESGVSGESSKLPTPIFSTDELDKALRKVRVKAYEMAQVGEWKLLSRLAQKIEARRSALGEDFVHKVAEYRPKAEDLTILHLLCLNSAPKALISEWLHLCKDKDPEAPVTFRLGAVKVATGNVRPVHVALVTGYIDAIEVFHQEKCNLISKTSTGDCLQSLLPLLESKTLRVYMLKFLLRCGVDPFEIHEKEGSFFTQSLKRNAFHETAAIMKSDAYLQYVKADTDRKDFQKAILGPLVTSFLYSINDQHLAAHSDNLLALIERLAKPSDKEFLKQSFAVQFVKKDSDFKMPVLHGAILHKRALNLVRRMLALGANPNSTGTYMGVAGTTAVHLACELSIPGLIPMLRSAGAKVDSRNQLGETPQQVFAKRVLLDNPFRSGQSSKVTATVMDVFGFIEPEVARLLMLISEKRRFAHSLEAILSLAEADIIEFDIEDDEDHLVFSMAALESITSFPYRLRHKKSFNISFAHHLLILETLHELGGATTEANRDSKSFTDLLPHLLTMYPPQASHLVARPFEANMDSNSRQKDHPNLVELMALINHPKDPSLAPHVVGPILTALTSASRWTFGPNGRTVRNWAKIGSFSFSFGFWKYDAMRVGGSEGTCLLEDYGFERCPQRNSDIFHSGDKAGKHWFGPGFWIPPGKLSFSYRKVNAKGVSEYRRFDSETSIEFRRSYISISHPKHGTLIIRNSSREFGRDLFPYPAYWIRKYYPGPLPDAVLTEISSFKDQEKFRQISPVEKSKDPLKSKAPERLTDEELSEILNEDYAEPRPGRRRQTVKLFNDVTEQNLYLNQGKSDSPSAAIEFLLEQLYALKQDYAAWKFDTRLESAWQDWGEYGVQLNGGYHSQGFSAVVAFLKDRLEKSKASEGKGGPPLPDLAFVHPDYPPWSEYHYKGPQGDAKRLRLAPKVIEVLDALARGEAKESDLIETGIRQFFQEGGFNTQGELVFLDQ